MPTSEVEQLPQAGEHRADARVVDRAEERGQVVDLHRRTLGDVHAVDLRGERRPGQPGALALGHGANTTARSTNALMAPCIDSRSLVR